MDVRSMIGDPSIDISMMPPQERSTRTRESAGIIALPAFRDMFDGREIAALCIGVIAIDIAAEDETALVRL